MSERLPPVNLNMRVLVNLEDVDNPGADMPDDAGIFAAALNDTPLNGDFLWHAASHLRDEEPEGPRPWEAFEEIFTSDRGIARRDDRTTTHPTRDVRNFAICWLVAVGPDKDPEHELGTRPIGYSRFFKTFIREHLPPKLDLNSFVGEAAMRMLSYHESLREGSVLQWRSWMGTDKERSAPPPPRYEFLKKYIGFLGKPGDGRMVWRKDQWGVPRPTTLDDARKQMKIEGIMRKVEDSLVRLSIRIANWLASWLVFSYVHKMMHLNDGVYREKLTPEDIANAVIEILGDEWFELPFDHEGKLKSWKNKRDFYMTEDQFDHIFGDEEDGQDD
jgi:hypothetical protein